MFGNNGNGQLGNTTENVKYGSTILETFIITLDKQVTQQHLSQISTYTPVKEGYTFAGWFKDEQMTVAFESGKMPAGDMSLYGYWIKN
jgi:uncharacterized repeat protein (TIGR02543 family)